MKDNSHNYFIDFLKFIFCFVIVIYHARIFNGTYGDGIFGTAYLTIDFYFIVTGYLMMNSIYKKKDYDDLGLDTFNFLKNKLIKLLPYIIFSFIVGLMYVYKIKILNFKDLFSNMIIGELIQIGSTGTGFTINTATWYISSMMIGLLILYPLARKYKNSYIYIISPIILIFLLTIVNSFNINVNDQLVVTFLGQNGIYKALIFIILGNYAYVLADKIRNIKIDKKKKIILTIIELFIYILLIITFYYNLFGTIFVALITLIGVAITFSNKSYTNEAFNHKIFSKLGKFGFVMFLNNTYVRLFIQATYPSWKFEDKFIFYISIVLIISLISYIIIDVIPTELKKKK